MNQVRAYEVDGLVTKYEGWEFLGIVKGDDDECKVSLHKI